MSSGTLFNAPFDKTVCQESMANFQRQLDAKKAHLLQAKNAHKEASVLITGEVQKISVVEDETKKLKKVLITIKNEEEVKQLRAKQGKYEDYIKTNRKLIAPYTESLEKLTKDIQSLEDEIHALEQLGSINSK